LLLSNAWTNSMSTNLYIPNHGTFVIDVWNGFTRKKECYILHESHLRKALRIMNPSMIWAFSDIGIVNMLSTYLSCTRHYQNLFSIYIGKKDISDILHPYFKSIQLHENVSAKTLIALSHILQNKHILDLEDNVFNMNIMWQDYDLNEHTAQGDGLIEFSV